MLFLYDLPNWVLGVLIVGVTTTLTFTGYRLFQKLFGGGTGFTDDNKGVAMAVLQVIATVNSLLLAFSAVAVWEAFGNADKATVEEGNTISSLARDLALLDTAESRHVRAMLKQYAEMVVQVEWQDMAHGRANLDTWDHFDRMFLAMGTIRADTATHQVLLPEIWACPPKDPLPMLGANCVGTSARLLFDVFRFVTTVPPSQSAVVL